jgi:ribosome-associated translation inhibitor RaiA
MTHANPRQFTWNLVTKNLEPHAFLEKKLHQKITKLERHLKHFPPDTVHLHVGPERHPPKEQSHAALTLRLPSNILRGERAAPDAIKAFDDAVKAGAVALHFRVLAWLAT